MKQLIVISLAAALFGCQSAGKRNETDTVPTSLPQTVSPDSLVIPGQALGVIRLGSDASRLMEIKGKPDGGDAAMGKATAIWRSGGYVTAIYTEHNMGVEDTSRIRQVRSTIPGFETENHIGVGVTLDEIRKNLAVAMLGEYMEGKDTFSLYTAPNGISFEINRRQQCTGIIIHPADSDPTKAYLPFHADLKKQ